MDGGLGVPLFVSDMAMLLSRADSGVCLDVCYLVGGCAGCLCWLGFVFLCLLVLWLISCGFFVIILCGFLFFVFGWLFCFFFVGYCFVFLFVVLGLDSCVVLWFGFVLLVVWFVFSLGGFVCFFVIFWGVGVFFFVVFGWFGFGVLSRAWVGCSVGVLCF